MKKKYHNGTSFSFISCIGEKLGERLISLNDILFGVIEAKPYKLEWEKIEIEYKNYKKLHGKVEIDIFSYDFVLGYSLLNDFATNEVRKEAMYLHLKAELLAKEVNGELDWSD